MIQNGTNSELARESQVFDLIWNNTTDAIFTIDHNGAIIDANPASVELFGWSVEELKGLTFPPFFSHITKVEHQNFWVYLAKLRLSGCKEKCRI